jgi:exosortase A-associated hydrolase 2
MNKIRRGRPAEPFFLKAGSGERFCLYYAPDAGSACRGAFIYVHPFGEEMNKSRRMAALQARSLASAGFGVLQIDLSGCGDSSGEFSDARWEIWKDDLATAKNWLENTARAPVSLWGLRLGALLALDFAMDSTNAVDQIVLWQPVISGETFLTQFLRMRLASEMLGGTEAKTTGTQGMRNAMAAGQSLEVAGYELAPALAAKIDSMNAVNLAVTGTPVHWFELVPEAGRPLPPPAARAASAWEQRGVDLHVHLVPGTQFWMSQEITECPALIAATNNLFAEVLS